jgi:hypothetical protein
MPKGPQGQKCSGDVIGAAITVAKISFILVIRLQWRSMTAP